MRNDFMSRPNERDGSALLQIPSAFILPQDPRYVIKHVLIGQPVAVDRTILHLQQLRYADATTWARPLAIGEPLSIAPAPGDVISTLIRYFRIE
ncbi:hypothetical protein H6F67_02830 [Microcoleus sp. FACHB-1515]|uniref:hypothetical protein n=1 Tax=Cyanophyceae TaxID=3028117 RepID=UPI0016878AC3|nr:hypothetical protein [Microcoleus sp. FACHB-1515]MBD2088796.1 hypothetical protein [Microcoleus sp. FACHB-1515]